MIAITRERIYGITVFAALLYVVLAVAFADRLFTSSLFNGDTWAESSILPWAFLVIILAAGYWQAQELPEGGVVIGSRAHTSEGQVDDPALWKLLLGNTWLSILWMPVRFFVGQEWVVAGEHKLRNSAWMDGGTALKGFWESSVAVPETGNPKVTYSWFRDFLQYMLDNEWYTWFAKVVAVGETLVGLGLIFGALVGIAAFFGTILNFNFLLAGTVSSNPVMFGLGVFAVLGWKVAGFVGLDRWLLPMLGTPWQAGTLTGQLRDTDPEQR